MYIRISVCVYMCTNVYMYICIGGLGVATLACPTPRNREIGFVSSSFSFRAVRAWCVQASGRGEAVRAHMGRCPSCWGCRVEGRLWICRLLLLNSCFYVWF